MRGCRPASRKAADRVATRLVTETRVRRLTRPGPDPRAGVRSTKFSALLAPRFRPAPTDWSSCKSCPVSEWLRRVLRQGALAIPLRGGRDRRTLVPLAGGSPLFARFIPAKGERSHYGRDYFEYSRSLESIRRIYQTRRRSLNGSSGEVDTQHSTSIGVLCDRGDPSVFGERAVSYFWFPCRGTCRYGGAAVLSSTAGFNLVIDGIV